MAFSNPANEDIARFLREISTVAVVGLSPKPNRPSHQVAAAMQNFGYRIIPVRPAVAEVLGQTAYADLYAVPVQIDLVNVFRASDQVDPIVDACLALRLPAIWFQDGVINEPAALRAQSAGLFVVMNRCIYRDYVNFCAT